MKVVSKDKDGDSLKDNVFRGQSLLDNQESKGTRLWQLSEVQPSGNYI